MYFELQARTVNSFKHSYWDAHMMGLDPQVISGSALTFNVGTGNIEKVTNLREKHHLSEVYVSEFEPTGY